ncbi:hypothetical protein [Corynebacterium diphtheriae]|uniref:hypothetical protein n=1 Tax=Corynebacterium diphtheriae TaxID=1717 RepID=UPI000B4B9F62|nr:hypothetical protein [Corynebacterium diphtheriae]OWM57821.1 hypothetical protein BU165_11635 [Corynebacterium diphtheriae]
MSEKTMGPRQSRPGILTPAQERVAQAIARLGVMSRDVVLAPARNDTVPIQEVSVQTACH